MNTSTQISIGKKVVFDKKKVVDGIAGQGCPISRHDGSVKWDRGWMREISGLDAVANSVRDELGVDLPYSVTLFNNVYDHESKKCFPLCVKRWKESESFDTKDNKVPCLLTWHKSGTTFSEDTIKQPWYEMDGSARSLLIMKGKLTAGWLTTDKLHLWVNVDSGRIGEMIDTESSLFFDNFKHLLR